MLLRDQLPPDACAPAVKWLGRRRDPAKAWRECRRADWMLWLLARTGADRRQLVLAACACARTALVHVPEGEDRPRLAIEAAEGWARGEVAIEEVRRAARAARAAYYAYYADADDAAAAANAALAAYCAALAADADDAALAAYYAALAADAVACAAAARADALAHMADLVRGFFPDPPRLA